MCPRLQQLDEENSELRSCTPCLKANIERLEEVSCPSASQGLTEDHWDLRQGCQDGGATRLATGLWVAWLATGCTRQQEQTGDLGARTGGAWPSLC